MGQSLLGKLFNMQWLQLLLPAFSVSYSIINQVQRIELYFDLWEKSNFRTAKMNYSLLLPLPYIYVCIYVYRYTCLWVDMIKWQSLFCYYFCSSQIGFSQGTHSLWNASHGSAAWCPESFKSVPFSTLMTYTHVDKIAEANDWVCRLGDKGI